MRNEEFYRNLFIQRGCSVELANAYIKALNSEGDCITKMYAQDELRRAGYDPSKVGMHSLWKKVSGE